MTVRKWQQINYSLARHGKSGRKGADNVRSDELQMSLGLRAFLGEVLTAVLGMPAR